MSLRPPVRTALLYGAWLLAFSVPPNLALHTVMTRTPRTRDIAGQIERYRRERTRYDMVFLGDSRAVLSIDPEQIDPLLGTHSLNLAHQANRLATQYASFLDLLPAI